MKKRKELNALIGLGDSKRKKTKKGSGHRLLRTEPPDSESDSSSDDDEFHNMDSGANFGKRSYTRCCNVCYPLFLFIILAACVMACAGLIWMQIALKEDLDSMKEKLHSIESSQKVSSSEIPKLSEDLKNKERKLDEVENGNKGLNKLWSNLTEMNRKISLLDTAVNHLKANLKSASDLINLPTTVEELQKSVATIGSTLTSVQHDVQTMQTAIEDQRREEAGPKKSMELTELRQEVSQANKTEEQHHTWTDEQIHLLLSTVAELHQRLTSLERDSVHSSKGAATQSEAASTSSGISGRPEEAQSSREEATTPAAPGDQQVTEKPRAPAEPQTNRQPRFLRPKRSQRSRDERCPASLSLPGVTSLKGLEEVFRQAGRDGRGLSFQELRKVLGASIPSARTLDCFDRDGDGRYSLLELRAAVGSHGSFDSAERY